MIWSSNRQRVSKDIIGDNRTKFLLAIIFLFALGIILRLFNVQVLNYDLYAAKASRQHGVEEEIIPVRGRIFVRAQKENSELYPLASNKKFALIYAVPKDILNPEQTAETLAPIFYPLIFEEPDMEKMMAEIESNIREQMRQEIEKNNPPALGVEIELNAEELQTAIEKERLVLMEKLEKEKEENLKNYQEELTKKFSKEDDPYEPLVKKVEKEKADEIMDLKIKGIAYDLSDYRYYPEKNISSHILGYVIDNPDNAVTQGSYGVEGYFNSELAGVMGKLAAERDASGQFIIVADRQIEPAVNGSDIILTIDKIIQNVACRILNIAALRHGADSGSVIIMEPETGKIIAMCAYPDFDPNEYGKTENMDYFNNINIFNAYEPGSVYKTMTMAMGLDLELVEPDTTFVDTGSYTVATETIRNADDAIYGESTMTEVLENSINTGAIFVARQVGINNFIKYTRNFGFGEKTGIELKTEVEGNISSLYDKMHGDNLNLAVSSFGQSFTTTPLQLAMAYAAIANQGILMKPYIIDEIIRPDGERIKNEPQEVRRVISPRAAALITGMIVNVVDGGHAVRAAVDGYYVAGKTGTAQIASSNSRGYSGRTNHTFVGFAPADDPKFVMIVYFENPKDVRYGASSAAPLFGEIAKFVLNYYQVEKER
ncbi:MAG: penicillin-binding protein 2 [Patescibacteria group bacterium]|jgi:cell division protein FtsI/penicillin-binding protein 2